MKILITTGISFNDPNLIKKEIESLKGEEFYRLGVKYNEHLFKDLPNIKIDTKAPNIGFVNPANYDKILIFKDFGFNDVNSGVDNLEKRGGDKVKVIDGWNRENPLLFQNKRTPAGFNVVDLLKYWSNVQPMDGTYLERSMSSTLTAEDYMERIFGAMSIDLKGDLPSMRVEMGKHSVKMFYIFRYLFPNIFSRTVWYGFMCHKGMVYCLYGSIPSDKNAVEITRVAFYPGTSPTTATMFAAVLRTMNPDKPNLPPRNRLYDIQKWKSFDDYIKDPDNAYLLSQDSFLGVNIQSGSMFLATLGEDGKIKMEGI